MRAALAEWEALEVEKVAAATAEDVVELCREHRRCRAAGQGAARGATHEAATVVEEAPAHQRKARRPATARKARIVEAHRRLDDSMAALRVAEAEEVAERAGAEPAAARQREAQATCEALEAIKAEVAHRAERER